MDSVIAAVVPACVVSVRRGVIRGVLVVSAVEILLRQRSGHFRVLEHALKVPGVRHLPRLLRPGIVPDDELDDGYTILGRECRADRKQEQD